jgi:hypothetical protein
LLEFVGDLEVLVVEIVNNVLLSDRSGGSADEIQVGELHSLDDLGFKRQVDLKISNYTNKAYLDIVCSFRKDHLERVVLSEEAAHRVEEGEVK